MKESVAFSLKQRASKFFFQRIHCRIDQMSRFAFSVRYQSLMSFHRFFQLSANALLHIRHDVNDGLNETFGLNEDFFNGHHHLNVAIHARH